MRILHLSDIHIGVENYGRPATEADIAALPKYFAPGLERAQYLGASTRLLDFLSTFDEAVAYAIDHDVDLVVFAGDAYKNRDPSQTHQREFARRIARLGNAGIPVFLNVGNHDLPHIANRATALEIFPTLSVANVTVAGGLGVHRMATPSGDVQIVALPWTRPADLVGQDETRDRTLVEIKALLEQRLTTRLAELAAGLDPATPALLCAHVTIAGATVASERGMMLGSDHMLSLEAVANTAFDYVALGHIHKHQILTQHPPVAYAGSLQRIDFTEEDQQKGFCLIDLDPSGQVGQRVQEVRFHEVDARPMATVEVQVGAGEDATDAAVNAIEQRQTQKPAAFQRSIVRVRVTMDAAQERTFREATVRRALAAVHHVAGIERRVQRDRRTRLDIDDAERLAPMEALRRYFASRNTPEEREAALLQYAEQLLREEIEGEVR